MTLREFIQMCERLFSMNGHGGQAFFVPPIWEGDDDPPEYDPDRRLV